jgi:hypothetical protein
MICKRIYAMMILAVVAAAVLTAGAAGDTYTLDWATLDSGGVLNAAGSGYALSATLGQPDAAPVALTGSGYTLVGGFWAGASELLGDLNCDGVISYADINPFVLALSSQSAYEGQYPSCRFMDADINGDGVVSYADINPFVALLAGAQ